MADNTNRQKLYSNLVKDGLYTKSYDEFSSQYSTPEAQAKLHKGLVSDGLYTKSSKDFTNQYFSDAPVVEKKNPIQKSLKPVTAGPSTQAKPKSSLGLGGQVVTGPSAFMPQQKPIIPSQPKTVEGQQKVGALDDLWNTFKGAGLNTLANLAKVPEMAQTYALDIVTTALGKNDEYNRLPAAAKKEIRNAVNSTSKVSPLPNVQLSNQAADYLNKRSEEVYQKTRKEEGDIVDEISNFANNPSAEGVGNILYRGLKSTVESVPFMAGYALSPALVGISAASGKRAEDLEKTGGNLGINHLLNSGIVGATEVLAQNVTNKIMGRAAQAAFGKPKAAEALGSGFKNLIIKEIGKDMGEEAIAEGVTQATQSISDDVLNGRDVDWAGTWRKALDAGITGAISAGTMRSGGQVVGSARNYLATKIMPKSEKEKIDNNIKTIGELNTQKGDDINPEVNTIIDNKIKELETQNTSMLTMAQSAVDNLTDDQIKQVVAIDDQLYENYNKAKAIFDDQSMDQDAKDLLLKDLLDKKNQLNEQKDAIQKQATSQVLIQPEAGVSGEVAKGEPQAEPQVPTEEVKAEKVTTPSETIEVFHGGVLPSLEEGRTLYVSEDASQANEYAKMSGGEVSKFFLDKNKIANEEDAFAIMEELGLEADGNFFELIDPRFDEALPEEDIKRVFDALKEKGFEAVKYTDIDQKTLKSGIENILVLDASKSLKTEPTATKEIKKEIVITPEQKTEQVNAVQKGIDAVDKALKRGRPRAEAIKGGISFMQKTIAYEEADDTTREQMLRDINKKFGVKEKKAPSTKKVLGEAAPTKVTINEATALKDQIRLEAKAAKGGAKFAEDVKNSAIDAVKAMELTGRISPRQFKAAENALKVNLLNPNLRERALNKIGRIIEKANYVEQVNAGKKINTAIKKAAKSKTLAPNIANMAKQFAKISPSNVTDIEEYIDFANKVYDSIGKPIRNIASVDEINTYVDNQLKETNEIDKNALLDEYNYLVEAGLIDSTMSLEDIQDYILDIENKKIDADEEKEKEIRKTLNKLFDSLSALANSMVTDGINPFTGEDVSMTEADKKLLTEFTKIDLDKLPIQYAYRAQEALMNYIVNGKKFGMDAILSRYTGEQNLQKMIADNMKAADFRWVMGGSWWGSRKWAKETEQIRGLFTWLWRGRERGRTMMKAMGIDDFLAGAARAKEDRTIAENEYIAKFLKKKPNDQKFNSITNTYERLVYAYMSRTVGDTVDKQQAEFDRRKKIIAQSIQAMEQSRNKSLIEEGKILKKVFDKVADAKTSNDVKDKVDKINQEAVEFISNKFDGYFEEVKDVAEGMYNIILQQDELYTPDMFRDISGEPINVEAASQTVDMPYNMLNKKQVGTLMENQRIPNLPGYDVKNNDASGVDRILKLDFDASAFNALEKTLLDTYTAKAVAQYSGFVSSKDFKKLFDNAEDEKLFKEIMNYYINNERGKVGYGSDLQGVLKVTNALKKFATYRALGSATAVVKQAASALVNTSLNLANDPYALGEVFKALNVFNTKYAEDVQGFINRNGGEINLRGAESIADIKSAERLLKESKYQFVSDVIDTSDKAGRFFMKSLTKGDVPLARASWWGYYIHALKKAGKPYKNVDWSKAEVDKDAASYANNEVSINQNASMTSTLGKLYSSKDPIRKLLTTMVFPYTSFLINAKGRLKTDITVLTSKLATQEDKNAAMRSIAATLAELPAYIGLSASFNWALTSLAYSIIGYDEDEEEKLLRQKRYTELAATRIITDLLSPFPNVGDAATVAGFNALLRKAQETEDMTKEEKQEMFQLFESKPESLWGAMAESLASPVVSTARRAYDIYDTFDKISGDLYEDQFGNELEFTDQQKQYLKIAATMQVLGQANLLPTEAETVAKRIIKTVEKEARTIAKEQ